MYVEPVNVPPAAGLGTIVRHELHHVREHWCWFFALGCALVVCGILALIFPLAASQVAVKLLSIVLLVAGVATLVGAFWTGRWSGFLLHVLVGMIYLAGGFIISDQPLASRVMITAYLAVLFMVMGMFRVIAALSHRYPQWGWTLLNGAITFLLGLVIYRHLPLDAVWVLGLLVGIELLFSGWAWIMLSLAIRRIPV